MTSDEARLKLEAWLNQGQKEIWEFNYVLVDMQTRDDGWLVHFCKVHKYVSPTVISRLVWIGPKGIKELTL